MIRIDGKDCTLMAWIPARGGSKGLPGKALRDLGGKPVIAHTIEYALSVPGMDRVLVNTDDEAIREAALACGAEVPFLRPAEIAQDHSTLEDALNFQWQWLEEHEGFFPDIHIGMSPTHPFRAPDSLPGALETAQADPNMVNIRGVVPTARLMDNYWVRANGTMKRFCFDRDLCVAGGATFQNLFSFNVVLECRRHLFYDETWKKTAAYPLTPLESVDLDDPKDLLMARAAMARGLRFDEPGPASTPGRNHVLGKRFGDPGDPARRRVLVHPDYPEISEADVAAFEERTRDLEVPAMTGCLVDDDVHPYRLLMENDFGRLDWAVDIPQTVRGARQSYPDVYRFIPAMTHLPAGCAPEDLATRPMAMIEMACSQLLDEADPLERLLLSHSE